MNIALTGGHLTPAHAFAEIASQYGDNLVMMGSAGQNSPECNELNKLGVTYHTIKTVKYNRHKKIYSILSLPSLPASIIKSIRVLSRTHTDIVVTFGSYNAVPVAIAAKILKIPYITHEQTRSIGLANKLIAKGATACTVSYEESLPYFPHKKTKLIGNLLRHAIWNPLPVPSLQLQSNLPLLYVTGGNQGSEIIVRAFMSIIKSLAKNYQIVLQHGKVNLGIDTRDLPNLIVKPWFTSTEAAWILHHAHMVITRGGANTISELMVAGIPSIIIPLKDSADDEQTKNAEMFTKHHAGILIPQKTCSGETLLQSIHSIEADYEQYQTHAHQLIAFQHRDAANILYQIVVGASK